MPGVYAQVTLLAASGNSEDNLSNIFAAESPGSVDATKGNAWRDAIKQFYEDVKAVGGMKGLAQSNHIIKYYEVPGGTPNYPVYENTFSFAAAPSAIDLPMEVSLCVSYANTTNNAVPRARRRGRIYLSGFGEGQNTAGRPISSLYQGVATAYADYALAVDAITDLEAGVWSRVDGEIYEIDTVWCDDEWDTQRRRGGKATTRYSVGI